MANPRKPARGAALKGASPLPRWIPPQLSKPADEAPAGPRWAREIKHDGYRLHARINRGRVALLTRTGLDWTANISAPSRRCVRFRSTALTWMGN